jgi:hypothetical protein
MPAYMGLEIPFKTIFSELQSFLFLPKGVYKETLHAKSFAVVGIVLQDRISRFDSLFVLLGFVVFL